MAEDVRLRAAIQRDLEHARGMRDEIIRHLAQAQRASKTYRTDLDGRIIQDLRALDKGYTAQIREYEAALADEGGSARFRTRRSQDVPHYDAPGGPPTKALIRKRWAEVRAAEKAGKPMKHPRRFVFGG